MKDANEFLRFRVEAMEKEIKKLNAEIRELKKERDYLRLLALKSM